MIYLACDGDDLFCWLVEEFLREAGASFEKVGLEKLASGGDILEDNTTIYAGGLTEVFLSFLKAYSNTVSGRLVVFVKPVENYPYHLSSQVKRYLLNIHKKKLPVLFVETTPVEHQVNSSLYPEFEHVLIPIFNVEHIFVRDTLPRDGAIVTRFDKCRVLEDLILELGKIGFTSLLINVNAPDKPCFNPFIIDVFTENPVSLLEKSIMGIIGVNDTLSNIVFQMMITDSRPVIACGQSAKNTRYDQTGLVVKVDQCNALDLANAVVNVFNSLESMRKKGTARFVDAYFEKDVERIKSFLA
ncbi:hypothetical protein IMZ38_03260 [Thermosphaera chiliense]|uniref:DUF354 domain-containing protein n=1 Tax=Thermosphaera chiliense TaxID=3402707 RepID=A0A7M1UTD6_9CREN|nr:hypothetical protein [Thermosphaera aggregans]QOR94937.1 hypothetical protein IMZ38_03260 [Thermosphaera aggregans]